MSKSKNTGRKGDSDNRRESQSIGNQQRTTQTGAQNAGGENIDQEEDRYTEDLRQSGQRTSSNRKNEDETGR